jgi:hypothetical protein
MNKNQKKALYESIMRQVAKTVKKALNESLEQIDIDELIGICHDLFSEEGKYVKDLLGLLKRMGRKGRYNIDIDDPDEALLAWHYGETPIVYKELFSYLWRVYDMSKDSNYFDDTFGPYENLYAELQKYPNTEYKEDLERCVKVGLQSALEDKGLI